MNRYLVLILACALVAMAGVAQGALLQIEFGIANPPAGHDDPAYLDFLLASTTRDPNPVTQVLGSYTVTVSAREDGIGTNPGITGRNRGLDATPLQSPPELWYDYIRAESTPNISGAGSVGVNPALQIVIEGLSQGSYIVSTGAWDRTGFATSALLALQPMAGSGTTGASVNYSWSSTGPVPPNGITGTGTSVFTTDSTGKLSVEVKYIGDSLLNDPQAIVNWITVSEVPEPASLSILVLSLGAMIWRRR